MRTHIDRLLRLVIIVLMAALVLDVVWQVVSRYVVRSPSPFTDELARILLIWVSFLSGAYVAGQNRHIAITFLHDRLDGGARRRLDLTIRALVGLFAGAVLVIGGGLLVHTTHTYLQLTPALGIPMAWVYSVGPISGLLILYYVMSERKEVPDGSD